MKGAYIFFANGFEETEAIAPTDVLRRGGVDVKTVSIYNDRAVTGAHNVPMTADLTFGEFLQSVELEGTTARDVMIFPGGLPGASNLAEHTALMDLMKKHYAEGGTVAAICASPGLVLSQLPVEGKRMTCYDGFQEPFVAKGAVYSKDGVVTDGNIVTGRGPGYAIAFGLGVLAHIRGEEAAKEVAAGMLI